MDRIAHMEVEIHVSIRNDNAILRSLYVYTILHNIIYYNLYYIIIPRYNYVTHTIPNMSGIYSNILNILIG